jgi:2-phospho-L-lactate guanylyltransferase
VGGGTSVLVPVKAFAAAKVRLAPALDAAGRESLARSMATRVVTAATSIGLPVAIACDDEGVKEWASSVGASVVWTPGVGLNGAVQQGFAALVAGGVDEVVIAHGDLPHAAGLERVLDGDAGVATIVPDRHDDGTNVLVLPASAAGAGFTFAYGVGSFARHVAEAERIGLAVRVLRLPELQWDVDTPDDLPTTAPVAP